MRFFKIVALEDSLDWWSKEFADGRLRFGWSPPGSDLRKIAAKLPNQRTPQERLTWRKTQFLLQRLQEGDVVIVQNAQPLRHFFLAVVKSDGYEYASEERPDFNHILHVSPLSDGPIPIGTKYVKKSLRHALSKRGHYYQIYPETARNNLAQILSGKLWTKKDAGERTISDEWIDHHESLKRAVIDRIRSDWPSTHFENFCAELCSRLPNLEVARKADSGKGWDLLIRVIDPVTNAPLKDNVPVQCKNFSGTVQHSRPIEDLVRCIENSDSDLAYLFILGDLSNSFLEQLNNAEIALVNATGQDVRLEVVGQDRIAELYLNCLESGWWTDLQ